MRDRLQAQACLALAGAVFVTVGTVCSRSPWLAAAGDGDRGVRRALRRRGQLRPRRRVGVAAAGVHPARLDHRPRSPRSRTGWPGGDSPPQRRLLAIAVLWPAPSRDPLRAAAIAACRALAARLRSDAAHRLGGADAPSDAEHDAAIAQSDDAVRALHRVFFATPYRPTGLSTAARTVVRLVDEINWLNAIVGQSPSRSDAIPVNRGACAVKTSGGRDARARRRPSRRPGRLSRRPARRGGRASRPGGRDRERHRTAISSVDAISPTRW